MAREMNVMSIARTVAAMGALGIVAACSQAPFPMPNEIDEVNQGPMSGGDHWRVLADHTVMKVFGCLEGLTYWNEDTVTHEPYCRQDVDRIRYTPIYIEQTESGTPFGEAFNRNLTTALVERGLELSLTRDGALALDTRVQVVERSRAVPLHAWPGGYTILGAGVAALAFGSAGLIASGAALDAYASGEGYGGGQVLITTMLFDGSRVVMSKTAAYYIEDVDIAHYASTAPAADLRRPMKAGSVPPAVQSMAVVEE